VLTTSEIRIGNMTLETMIREPGTASSRFSRHPGEAIDAEILILG
jgi:hypothetical protein